MPKTMRAKCNGQKKSCKELLEHLGVNPLLDNSDKWNWDRLNGRDWSYMLIAFPDLAAKYVRWEKLENTDYARVLEMRPELSEQMPDEWPKLLKNENWMRLLSVRPEFATKCNCLDKFNAIGCANILDGYCRIAKQKMQMTQILMKHLAKLDAFPWSKIRKCISIMECVMMGESKPFVRKFIGMLTRRS